MSAKIRFLSFTGGLLSTVIVLITLVSFYNFKSSSVSGYTNQLQTQAQLILESVDQKIQRYFDSLNLMSDMLAIDEQGNIDVEKVTGKLTHMMENLNIVSAYVGLENGVTYLPSGEIKNFNAKKLNREWYTRIFSGEKEIITTPFTSSSGDLVMALAVPVTRQGKVVATLNLNIPINSITHYIESLSESNQIFTAREDGFLLSAIYPDFIGKNLYEKRPSYSAYRDRPGVGHYYNSNGKTYFVINAKAKTTGWTVWAWDTKENIESASRHNLFQSIGLSIVLITTTLVALYFLITKLMYVPIGGEPKQIERMVQQVSEGDLTISNTNYQNTTGILAATLSMVANFRNIIKQINSATDHLGDASQRISDVATTVNQSSENQMEQLEQSATAMNQMSITVCEVARNAQDASVAAEQAYSHSLQGMNVVNDMNNSINNLVQGIENVVEVNCKLEAETQSIDGILEVIDGISEQTNLLALNAAIEAARAGEYGRGFAVVADEVRSLANRTKESTSEIQSMISHLQIEAKRSVKLMQANMADALTTSEKSGAANNALLSIQTSVSAIQNMNEQIATAAEQQTLVASEINSNITAISELAKSTFESSNSNMAMANELTDIAESLNKSVDLFKL